MVRGWLLTTYRISKTEDRVRKKNEKKLEGYRKKIGELLQVFSDPERVEELVQTVAGIERTFEGLGLRFNKLASMMPGGRGVKKPKKVVKKPKKKEISRVQKSEKGADRNIEVDV